QIGSSASAVTLCKIHRLVAEALRADLARLGPLVEGGDGFLSLQPDADERLGRYKPRRGEKA
ncbi:MAG: hypothetical protein WBW73_29620, partial [Rhodoplanes sp.]